MRRYFGTDGIRDRAGQGLLAPELLKHYGQGLGAWLDSRSGPSKVLFGRDTRESGPSIVDALAEGLQAAGHHVVDGGVLSTPAVQCLVREESFALAIVISASHNPAHDNGIKLFGGDGRKLADAAELALEGCIALSVAGKGNPGVEQPGERSCDEGAVERYLEHVRTVVFPNLDLSGQKIVLDSANGAASAFGARLLESFGAEVVSVACSPDGQNINDGCGVFGLDALSERVRAEGASIGLGLDGDADRVLFVDETGAQRDGDHILGLLAEDAHRRDRLPGGIVVTTVMSNLGLKIRLRALGLVLHEVPVGDRNVSAKMAEVGGVLGGEQSGHVILRNGRRWYGDGLVSALEVLSVLARRGATLSELAGSVRKYPQVLINVPVRDKTPVESVPAICAAREAVTEAMGEDGRILLRYSGTEPLLRVMVEGPREPEVEGWARSIADAAEVALG